MTDLHIHSNYSDGIDNLSDLIDNVVKAKIDCFALTDHDTAEGCRIILSKDDLKLKLKENHIDFIVGAEWTCVYGSQKMHILAYDFDPFDDKILKLESDIRNMLDEKDRYRMFALENMGMKLSQKSKDYLNSKDKVRSIDFAKCLVDDGYYNERQQAFNECLNKIKYPFEFRYDIIKILPILKKCGAKVVWAHSIYDMERKVTSFDDVEKIIKELKPYGLDGLECCYSLYSKDEIEELMKIAKRNNLFITCGSDYHGKNKEVKLGQFSADNTVVCNMNFYDIFKNILRNN